MDSWTTIANRLTNRRRDVTREIRSFPAPIPVCDVYYNSLLEERRKISDELQKLEVCKAKDKNSVDEFISQCSLIDFSSNSSS